MTFEVPDEIARAFRTRIPSGERSKVIAQAMKKQVQLSDEEIRKACLKANRNKKLTAEMKEWDSIQDGVD